jgi:hypothetical protein
VRETNLSDTEINSLKAKAQSGSESEVTAECILLGNSIRSTPGESNYKQVVISKSAQIYAAGNLTFFTDTTISGGTVTCAGRLTSKNDLTISGGTVTAEHVGNARDLTTTASGLTRWKTTTISGGTVTTNSIGAVSGFDVSKSTVVLDGTATINPLDNAKKVDIIDDVYVNYVCSGNLSNPENNTNNIRLNGNVKYNTFDNMSLQTITFAAPLLNEIESDTTAWNLDNLVNPKVDGVSLSGVLTQEKAEVKGDGINSSAYTGRTSINLYAITTNYNLTISEGADQIATITQSGRELSSGGYQDGQTVSASANAETVITLKDSDMAQKTVVWYFDGNGILHNAMPTVEGKQIKFSMPYADTEIYVTDELKLYLNLYEIVFTAEGFSVDYALERADASFSYAGDLRVTQSDVYEISFQSDNIYPYVKQYKGDTKHLVEDTVTAGNYGLTTNRMRFTEGSGNGEGQRNITFEKLMQMGIAKDYGTEIPKGESVIINIDGAVTIFAVHVPEGAALVMQGVQGDDHDIAWLKIRGNKNVVGAIGTPVTGKAGNVTVKNH